MEPNEGNNNPQSNTPPSAPMSVNPPAQPSTPQPTPTPPAQNANQDPQPVGQTPQSTNAPKKRVSKLTMIIIIILVLVCLAAAGVIAYNTFFKQDMATKETSEITAATPIPFDEQVTPSPTSSPQEVQSEIVTALDAQDYNTLVPFMAESVQFEIEASEGIPAGTPQEAVEQLGYLNTAASPWDFDQANEIITQVKAQNPDEYGNLYIGISSNNVLAAFGFDESGLINVIKVAVTYKLLVSE